MANANERNPVKETLGVTEIPLSNTTVSHPDSAQISLKMDSGAFYKPKDNSLKPQGEDAHFICAEKQTFGVADGVGGWAACGIDAGEYARELMYNSTIATHTEPEGGVDPKRVLKEAFMNTKVQGSSTACIVTLAGYYLHAANVGDSGFMVFRENKCIYKSPVHQKGFNHPYQLGNDTSSDRPSCAIELKVAVIPGDVVVAGTDGLLDNMHASEIENLFKKQGNNKEDVCPDQLAWTIAGLASNNSLSQSSDTPYAMAARKAGYNHSGGKIDDVTVVVAYIV